MVFAAVTSQLKARITKLLAMKICWSQFCGSRCLAQVLCCPSVLGRLPTTLGPRIPSHEEPRTTTRAPTISGSLRMETRKGPASYLKLARTPDLINDRVRYRFHSRSDRYFRNAALEDSQPNLMSRFTKRARMRSLTCCPCDTEGSSAFHGLRA
jgi:hypothetical protein